MNDRAKDELSEAGKKIAKYLEEKTDAKEVCIFIGFRDEEGCNTFYLGDNSSLATKIGYLEVAKYNILNAD